MRRFGRGSRWALTVTLALVGSTAAAPGAAAQAEPTVLDSKLAVRTAADGLDHADISIAFLGRNDMLVLEKDTGKVQRVTGGALGGTR